MLAWNHYEVAFRAFLQEKRVPFLAIYEQQRCRFDDGESVKSLDFVLSRPNGMSWLIDVKGRRFPSGAMHSDSAGGFAERTRNGGHGGRSHGGYWKHWSTRDDLVGISKWEKVFGESYAGLFVFAYEICGSRSPVPVEQVSFVWLCGNHFGGLPVRSPRFVTSLENLFHAHCPIQGACETVCRFFRERFVLTPAQNVGGSKRGKRVKILYRDGVAASVI